MNRVRRRALAATLITVALSSTASAHFVLKSPESWSEQDALGSPQKLGPCGDDGAKPTGIVSSFVEGDTVTITVDETIFHPGHYRVALAVNDRSELPDDPPVTPGSTACGSTVVQSPAVFPVLLDGALAHDKAFSAPMTMTVKLPAGVTCQRCTLQVIEFMSQHGLNDPGGCFYHHCADLSIRAAGGAGGSVGATGGPAGAGGAGPEPAGAAPDHTSGCGCRVERGRSGDMVAFVALALWLGARRRSSRVTARAASPR